MSKMMRRAPPPAISKIRDAIYDVTFDPKRMDGKVIANISYVDSNDLDSVIDIYRRLHRWGLSIGPYIKIVDENTGGKVGILTICSITIDGVLLKSAVPSNPIGGGVLYVESVRGVRFTDFLKYESTTMDPLETLAGMGLTSIMKVVETGSGRILANVREVPMIAKDDVETLLGDMVDAGFSGVIEVGEPNTDIFDIPTGRDHFGIVIAGGINPLVAADEMGIAVENHAMRQIVEISEMERISDV